MLSPKSVRKVSFKEYPVLLEETSTVAFRTGRWAVRTAPSAGLRYRFSMIS
jgi:hypothetical protein